LGKQEARSFHRPALQIPANIEIRFTKVRSAKKKKDKTGRRLGRGSNVGENLRRTGDLSLRDTSNFVLWEFSVSFRFSICHLTLKFVGGRKNTHPS
jgi:transcription initiation factor TFIID subunit 1